MGMDEMQVGAARYIGKANRAIAQEGDCEAVGDILSRLANAEHAAKLVGSRIDVLNTKLERVLRPSLPASKMQSGQSNPKEAISHLAERLEQLSDELTYMGNSLDNIIDRADI